MVGLSAILAYITGVPNALGGPYLVCAEANSDPYIDRWDESVLGPQPTDEQIAEAGLALAIEARTVAVQAGKCQARDAGFDVSGVHFDSDQAARTAYLELAMEIAANPAYSTDWKASTGVWVTMDATLFAQVKLAGTTHVQSCFAWQATRDAELAAIQAAVDAGTMSDAEAIAAIEAIATQFV